MSVNSAVEVALVVYALPLSVKSALETVLVVYALPRRRGSPLSSVGTGLPVGLRPGPFRAAEGKVLSSSTPKSVATCELCLTHFRMATKVLVSCQSSLRGTDDEEQPNVSPSPTAPSASGASPGASSAAAEELVADEHDANSAPPKPLRASSQALWLEAPCVAASGAAPGQLPVAASHGITESFLWPRPCGEPLVACGAVCGAACGAASGAAS
mmetsp:Transcript_114300/g.255126  ORF Transcript_114300/g.255126 Transcript_114300/m.255126 type:complete len:213 (+) Transcript_114300:432-1070(+)